MGRLRIGIVGCGWISGYHGRACPVKLPRRVDDELRVAFKRFS